MPEYLKRQHFTQAPRLPLKGSLDLTYRCNNTCRHCWLWLADSADERANELTLDEIQHLADDARALGCREWAISGGEPMLRLDFPEIFDFLTHKAIAYSLNTNGTLITPEIARLLKRKGNKMVALYGATAETYDRVTRHPGGFEMAMRGFRHLREAGAGFTVQLIPMRDNWHEWEQMQALAQSLSPHWRVGAPWLFMSAQCNAARNAEIARQRLDPADVIELDRPNISDDNTAEPEYRHSAGDDRLFASCIAGRRDFHVDPYGGMTFCSFVKDPAMRYDLRRGTFQEAWDHFIPSLAEKVHGGPEYTQGCAECDMRADCRWCPVYGYLEHGRFSAPVEYLCAVAREARNFKEAWMSHHRRYYRIADITIQVDCDLPISDATFSENLNLFRAEGPGDDTVTLRHHFGLPDLRGQELGQEVYRKPPWAIYRSGNSWNYLGISPRAGDPELHRVVTFNHDHTRARIYNDRAETYLKGDLHSLTLFPSDQILVARLLADRQGCYLHSAGAILNGAGMLFVGHSDAGKSTTTRLLMDANGRTTGGLPGQVTILCDDRNIVRRRDDGWRVYGTWSHGDVPVVSPRSAPLRAICFIEQAGENSLSPLTDRREINHRLLACLIKPFVTTDWWEKTLDVIERLAHEAPCYVMRFDKSGAIVDELAKLAAVRYS